MPTSYIARFIGRFQRTLQGGVVISTLKRGKLRFGEGEEAVNQPAGGSIGIASESLE